MEKKLWDFLYSKLHNPYGVSALMGNLYVESKLNPALLEGSYAKKFGMTSQQYIDAVDNGTYDNFAHDSAGFGLVQWTYWSRKESLYNFAKSRNASIGDFDMQLDFIWEEIQKYKTVLNALYYATNIREVSDIVAKKYEKPAHLEEKYLQNRANYGQAFYDKYAEGIMNTWKQVNAMLIDWKAQKLDAPTVVVKLANACIGWAYVFGARGEQCTPANRRAYYKSKGKPTIKSKCKNFDGTGSCSGCKWYPNGVTLIYDCRGFTYWLFLKGAGIVIKGGGATSQFNDDSNWEEKGTIANMPKDKVCCVFRYDSGTKKYEHTLLYDGNGHYIHCSGEVKKTAVSGYKATHYAIPKGLYGGGGGGDEPVIGKAKVTAKSGSTVNLRSNESTTSSIITQIKIGTIVDVISKGATWSKVQYNGRTGYMKNEFLIMQDEPSGDTISVSKSELKKAYDILGAMLK